MVQGDELKFVQNDTSSFADETIAEQQSCTTDFIDESDGDFGGEDAVKDEGCFNDDDGFENEGDSCDESDEYEVVELEFDEDDIVRYLEDEEGRRIGFVLIEDDEEVEYLYVDEDDDENVTEDDDEIDFGVTTQGIAQATQDMNAIYKDGAAVVSELKGAFDDIKSALDFSTVFKK